MTRCPSCGKELAAGKAYCENPACRAVPGGGGPVIKNEIDVGLRIKLDFAVLARTAAVVLVLLALACLYFLSGRPAPR